MKEVNIVIGSSDFYTVKMYDDTEITKNIVVGGARRLTFFERMKYKIRNLFH